MNGENQNDGNSESARIMPHTAREYRRRVCQAMNFISQHIERDLTLEEIAEAARFSKFHFHRIFKAVVGETVADYTRRLRLELAANRLVGGDDDITSIALECGFSSSQNFAKAFRGHFGLTPSAYRKSKVGNKFSKGEDALSLRTVYPSDPLFDRYANTQPRRPPMAAEVRDMPDYHVAYVRIMGPYGKETCERAFGELTRWAGPRGFLRTGAMLCLYWDNPEVTPPDRCRTDACLSVPEGTKPEGAIGLQMVAGGPHLAYRVEVRPDGFRQAWEDAFAWLVQHGYECDDRPCYELYHNDAQQHPEGKWIVEICIPLKRQ